MKVALDTHTVFSAPTGARTYFLELLPELVKLVSPEDELVVLHSARYPPPEPIVWTLRGPNVRRVAVRPYSRLLNRLWRSFDVAPAESTREPVTRKLDVCHSAHPALLPPRAQRRILTVQALNGPRENGSAFSSPRAVARSARRADLIITPTERTKTAISESLAVPTERIVVIPNGVHRRFTEPPKASDVETLCQRYPFLQEPYLLALGSAAEPGRNLTFLISAYRRARRVEGLAPLVVAGVPGRMAEASAEIAEQGLKEHVLLVEDIEPETLPALYRGAEVLLYPARDVFGQALLEAAACAVPIVADPSCGALELLRQGVARPPRETEAWAEAIVDLLADETGRRDAAQQARREARGWTWEASARRHWRAYRGEEGVG